MVLIIGAHLLGRGLDDPDGRVDSDGLIGQRVEHIDAFERADSARAALI